MYICKCTYHCVGLLSQYMWRQHSHDYLCLPLSGLGDHNRHVNCRQPLPHEYMSIHVCMYIGAHNRYGNCMYIPLVQICYLSVCVVLVCVWTVLSASFFSLFCARGTVTVIVVVLNNYTCKWIFCWYYESFAYRVLYTLDRQH